MPLTITKAEDPIHVDRINICIYAQPGVGKSSLAFTSDTPLLLDFDKGAHRAGNRKDIVRVNSWADADGISQSDLEQYRTVVVDTAGRALDSLAVDIITKNPKLGRGGALTLQGYGELKSRFAGFTRLLNSFGKDVVLVCHMDEQRNGDEVIERLDAQGSSKGEIYKSVDAMGRIFVRGGKRFLDFSPREGSFGKNPGQFSELEIPHPASDAHFLANVIASIKDKLNEQSLQQMKTQQEIEEWNNSIVTLTEIEEFNSLLKQIIKAPPVVQASFNKAANAKGFTFNKKTKLYEPAAVAA